MQKAAIQLTGLIESPDLIVTSPYLRARQTADILGAVWPEARRLEAAELVPEAPPTAYLRWLQAHGRDIQNLIAVGHEPQLSIFATYVLAGRQHALLEIKKGGVAALRMPDDEDLGPSSAELRWLIHPKMWRE